MSTSKQLAGRTDGLTGADIESLCKKATLLAIAEFQAAPAAAPFVVRRSRSKRADDFDAVTVEASDWNSGV